MMAGFSKTRQTHEWEGWMNTVWQAGKNKEKWTNHIVGRLQDPEDKKQKTKQQQQKKPT